MIEPTPEQREAAGLYCVDNGDDADRLKPSQVAWLLVEREAPLRVQIADLVSALKDVALYNAVDDMPCFCVIRIPAGTAHHLSCQRARRALAKAGA